MAYFLKTVKKFELLILVVIGSFLIPGGAGFVQAQPKFCTDEVFPLLSRGVEALQAGNDEAARQEFEKVIKIDQYNSYALNNLGVLAEKQGKLKEAMAYLLDAETYAAEYLHKSEAICEAGGFCLAVAPAADKSKASSIAAIVHSNINLLKATIGKAKN
jgi:tetratricopeptide (TPR) repeat protein